jgi:hypothetical protein
MLHELLRTLTKFVYRHLSTGHSVILRHSYLPASYVLTAVFCCKHNGDESPYDYILLVFRLLYEAVSAARVTYWTILEMPLCCPVILHTVCALGYTFSYRNPPSLVSSFCDFFCQRLRFSKYHGMGHRKTQYSCLRKTVNFKVRTR